MTTHPSPKHLVVVRAGLVEQAPLKARGTLLGRDPASDVVLDDVSVSRRHARIFQDPFGRWIIEDLASHNGVWVKGVRVAVHAVMPGESIAIGPFALSLPEELPVAAVGADGPSPTTRSRVVDQPLGQESVETTVSFREILSADRIRQLNQIMDKLAALVDVADVCPQVCRLLGESFGASNRKNSQEGTPACLATVLRLPCLPAALPPSPVVLAHHLGEEAAGLDSLPATPLHFSRRVLEAIRSGAGPVRASSVKRGLPSRNSAGGLTDGADLELTALDSQGQRTVWCTRISECPESLDVLYVDVDSQQAPADMADFVQAVSRQAWFAQRSLLLAEAVRERNVIDHQLALAKVIQRKLTPSSPPQVPGVDVALFYQPAMWVGGDYCDLWQTQAGRLLFAVGDVSGKGLPAAMAMANLHAALRLSVTGSQALGEAVSRVNQYMRAYLPEGMFVTLFLGAFDAGSGRLVYVNAGHILPVLLSQGGVGELGLPRNAPLGVAEGLLEAESVTLAEGDGLVIVTDGITESRNPDGQEFGVAALLELLAGPSPRTSAERVERVTQAAADFRSACLQQDDITVLALMNRAAARRCE